MLDESVDCIMKVVLVGDSSVGKTNLLLRYTKNEFSNSTKPTIGTDFFSKTLNILSLQVKVQFWDTAGQEKYRSLASSYYKEAHGIILVYDITRRKTFQNCTRWIQDIKDHVTGPHEILLVGNKADLIKQRDILPEEGLRFAQEHRIKFMEVSAKTNMENCVQAAFDIILHDSLEKMSIYKQILTGKKEKSESIRLNTQEISTTQNNRMCC